MINANESTHQTTTSPSSNPKLAMLAYGLGLIVLATLYVKIIGF